MLSLGLLANVITDETTLTVVQVGGNGCCSPARSGP